MGHRSRSSWQTPAGRLLLAAADVHVWRGSLDVSEPVLCALSASLSQDERCRASQFASDRDRRRFIACRGMLRAILGGYLGMDPAQIDICYGPFGKPALAGSQALRFNLSHSRGLGIVAVCIGREIGVDVEAIRPMPLAEQIAERNFSIRERRQLQHLPPTHRLDGFFNGWTRKEAFLKATGDGLTRALDDFDVSLAPGLPAALLRVGADPQEAARWSVAALTPAPDYVAAVVLSGRVDALSCWTWGGNTCADVVGVRFAKLRVL